MLTLQSIFTNGWLQIIILLIVFWSFSRWSLQRGAKSGYAIGLLIGLFFIVAYGALFPNTTIQFAAEGPAELTLFTVFMSAIIGAFIGLLIVGITFALRKAWFRQTFAVAGITSVLVTMLFAMVISSPQGKMALTLATLAFAIVIATTYILRRAYMQQSDDDIEDPLLAEEAQPPVGTSRIDRIREQVSDLPRY